jgi:hypothetical protein
MGRALRCWSASGSNTRAPAKSGSGQQSPKAEDGDFLQAEWLEPYLNPPAREDAVEFEEERLSYGELDARKRPS